MCRRQRVRLLGAPGRPDQGRVLPRRRRRLFDAETCAFTGLGTGGEENYDWSIYGEDPAQEGGIFDFARADNPFRDYSFIYVPSCTGDAHLGDVTREYSPELTVEHNGFVNGTAALNYLAEHYPDAAQVVVVGKTVGSIAAPVYGGLAADLLPDAQVTVFGGQSGHIPDDPDLNAEFFGELWGAYANMPDWEVNEGLTARDWGAHRFWIQAGLHDPEIVLARFDYAYDPESRRRRRSIGCRPVEAQLAVIDANEAAIEKAGVVLHSYTAPGDGHGIFEWPKFYELEVNGEKLVDWVTRLIEGKPVDDVQKLPELERRQSRWGFSGDYSREPQNGKKTNRTRHGCPSVLGLGCVNPEPTTGDRSNLLLLDPDRGAGGRDIAIILLRVCAARARGYAKNTLPRGFSGCILLGVGGHPGVTPKGWRS